MQALITSVRKALLSRINQFFCWGYFGIYMNISTIYKLHKLEILLPMLLRDCLAWLSLEEDELNAN